MSIPCSISSFLRGLGDAELKMFRRNHYHHVIAVNDIGTRAIPLDIMLRSATSLIVDLKAFLFVMSILFIGGFADLFEFLARVAREELHIHVPRRG
jgi:hypothetical protein